MPLKCEKACVSLCKTQWKENTHLLTNGEQKTWTGKIFITIFDKKKSEERTLISHCSKSHVFWKRWTFSLVHLQCQRGHRQTVELLIKRKFAEHSCDNQNVLPKHSESKWPYSRNNTPQQDCWPFLCSSKEKKNKMRLLLKNNVLMSFSSIECKI